MEGKFGDTIMEDTDIITFGKYSGKRMIDVPADWLLWFYEETKNNRLTGDRLRVWKYCHENLQALKLQTKK